MGTNKHVKHTKRQRNMLSNKKGCDLLGASKKGKDAKKRMQAHKGQRSVDQGAQLLQSGLFFLSLSLLSRACIGVPLFVHLLLFLLLAWATFLGYGNVCFTFPVPCWVILLESWQCLIYFLALCGYIVHDVCISISSCLWAIVHFL